MRIPNIIGWARRLVWLAIVAFALLVAFAWVKPGATPEVGSTAPSR